MATLQKPLTMATAMGNGTATSDNISYFKIASYKSAEKMTPLQRLILLIITSISTTDEQMCDIYEYLLTKQQQKVKDHIYALGEGLDDLWITSDAFLKHSSVHNRHKYDIKEQLLAHQSTAHQPNNRSDGRTSTFMDSRSPTQLMQTKMSLDAQASINDPEYNTRAGWSNEPCPRAPVTHDTITQLPEKTNVRSRQLYVPFYRPDDEEFDHLDFFQKAVPEYHRKVVHDGIKKPPAPNYMPTVGTSAYFFRNLPGQPFNSYVIDTYVKNLCYMCIDKKSPRHDAFGYKERGPDVKYGNITEGRHRFMLQANAINECFYSSLENLPLLITRLLACVGLHVTINRLAFEVMIDDMVIHIPTNMLFQDAMLLTTVANKKTYIRVRINQYAMEDDFLISLDQWAHIQLQSNKTHMMDALYSGIRTYLPGPSYINTDTGIVVAKRLHCSDWSQAANPALMHLV